MKATGIVAEYNPLHNGHVYHMEQARKVTGCDVCVVAMSGDYVQRGEPAIMDKWMRTEHALECGADLVIEIPTLFCLGNAGMYAAASVGLLEALGCASIAFGSESGDVETIKTVACILLSRRAEIAECISGLVKDGLSYPAARERAYRALRTDADPATVEREISVMNRANDILALEYVMNMHKAVPVCIKRAGKGYHEGISDAVCMQSASGIREALKKGAGANELSGYVPPCTADSLVECKLTFLDEWTQLLRYAVMSTPADAIERCPSAGEGLANRLKEAALYNDTWDGIITAAKSKRYTYTRLSRLCMQLILGIDREAYSSDEPGYIRVLGFGEKGREYISYVKNSAGCSLPVITNINKEAHTLGDEAKRMLELDVHAADVYNLVTGRGENASDHVRTPVIKK